MKQVKIRYNNLYRRDNSATLMLSPDNTIFSDGNIALINEFHLDKQTQTKSHVNYNLTLDRINALADLNLKNEEVNLTQALNNIMCESQSELGLLSYTFRVNKNKYVVIQQKYYNEIVKPLLVQGCTFKTSEKTLIPNLQGSYNFSYINGINIYYNENLIGIVMPMATRDDILLEDLKDIGE